MASCYSPTTLFTHKAYTFHEQYTNGVADMVPYWAENQILGGIALFDRSHNWDDTNSEPNVYLHPARAHVTFRIYQLLDEQQDALLKFLMTKSSNRSAN